MDDVAGVVVLQFEGEEIGRNRQEGGGGAGATHRGGSDFDLWRNCIFYVNSGGEGVL